MKCRCSRRHIPSQNLFGSNKNLILQRFYQTLSEIKSEIESIIVAGRKLVEEKNVSEPDKLSKRIDTLKELYNKV